MIFLAHHIKSTDSPVDQSRLGLNTCMCSWYKVWKKNVSDSQLVLALTLIDHESGACFRNQSQSPVMQNQCRCELLWHIEKQTLLQRCPFQSLGWEVPQGSLTLPKRYKQLIMLLHPRWDKMLSHCRSSPPKQFFKLFSGSSTLPSSPSFVRLSCCPVRLSAALSGCVEAKGPHG